MTQNQFNTISRKGKHLSLQERTIIQEKHRAGLTNRQIATYLNHAPQTINNEIKRGTTTKKRKNTQNGKDYIHQTTTYFTDTGQAIYERNRLNCGRPFKFNQCAEFIAFADEKMTGFCPWSPEAVILFAKQSRQFPRKEIPSTRTLYNWIDLGLLKTINLELLLKNRRKTKSKRVRKNRTVLGTSIEKWPASVNNRHEFGHWEMDTVVGLRDGQEAFLVKLIERKTRYELIMKADGKTTESVTKSVNKLLKMKVAYFPSIFRTITSDNGTEFANLSQSLNGRTNVYFTHPYFWNEDKAKITTGSSDDSFQKAPT